MYFLISGLVFWMSSILLLRIFIHFIYFSFSGDVDVDDDGMSISEKCQVIVASYFLLKIIKEYVRLVKDMKN